jgi:hypothetical protein
VLNHSRGKLSKTYNQHNYAAKKKMVMEAVVSKLLAIINGTDDADNVVEFRK